MSSGEATMLDHPANCSCCGYDQEIFSPEAHHRRNFLKLAGLGVAAAGSLSASGASATPTARWPQSPTRPRDIQLAQAQAPAAPVREIAQIGGNLYRFRNNFHFSVFAVTPQGVICTDPINADAARWLKGEIQTRFNQPVRYVVYSHDHWDHINGGDVFADTAVFVAHDNARKKILGEKRATAVPSIVFDDAMAIELGGTRLELSYVGRNHSDNSIVMRFPAQRALFAVDFIPVESLAFRVLQDGYVEDWIESLKRVEKMDFDILLPGHGPVGRREHVAAFRGYLETLHDEVLAGLRAGRDVAQLKESIKLERYANWAGYQQMRELNIEGMHRYLSIFRIANPS
jgi:glyoxylase-like metal-dependent hydrolase (beta-lactamase superfamily II)